MELIRMVKKINKQTAVIATAVGKTGTIALHYWVRISGKASESALLLRVCIYILMYYFNAISQPLKVTTSYVSENKQVLSDHIIYHLVLRFDHTTILKTRINSRMLPHSYGSLN